MRINDETGWWMCACGNEPELEGFYPCNSEGEIVEPTPELWNGLLYVCDKCGRIINQDTLEVVGVRFNNLLTEQEKKEIMEA